MASSQEMLLLRSTWIPAVLRRALVEQPRDPLVSEGRSSLPLFVPLLDRLIARRMQQSSMHAAGLRRKLDIDRDRRGLQQQQTGSRRKRHARRCWKASTHEMLCLVLTMWTVRRVGRTPFVFRSVLVLRARTAFECHRQLVAASFRRSFQSSWPVESERTEDE